MHRAYKYALLYNNYELSPIFRIPFEKFVIALLTPPLFAFLFCIGYSILYEFEHSTFTHCNVFNILPSVSTAIGSFTPQREVWQAAIAFQVLPRVVGASWYLKLHRSVLYPHDSWMSYLAYFLNIGEIIALIILSFWTSSQYYPIHEKAFITFVLTSEFYMILLCIIQRRSKRRNPSSLFWKTRLVIVNISCILLATYCFIRHNLNCEPYVYSVFALAEYVVVLSNMAFHMTSYLDFKNRDLVIYKFGVTLTER